MGKKVIEFSHWPLELASRPDPLIDEWKLTSLDSMPVGFQFPSKLARYRAAFIEPCQCHIKLHFDGRNFNVLIMMSACQARH